MNIRKIVLASLIPTLCVTSALALTDNHRNVEWPGFVDHFTINLTNVLPSINYNASTGGVSGGNNYCKNNQCFFSVADAGSGDNGTASFTIGSPSAAYCKVTITDGPWVSFATMSSQCYNGAGTNQLTKTDQYNYQFTISA